MSFNDDMIKKKDNIFDDNTDVDNLGISAEILRFAKNGSIETVEKDANNISTIIAKYEIFNLFIK